MTEKKRDQDITEQHSDLMELTVGPIFSTAQRAGVSQDVLSII